MMGDSPKNVVVLEAANQVIQKFGQGTLASVIPVESDEPHVQLGRSLNRWLRDLGNWL